MTAKKRSLGSDLRKVDRRSITAKKHEEAPEWTDEQWAKAVLGIDGKPVRRGRPPLARPKEAVTLRIDADILDHFREKGPGWQTRINEALRKAARKPVKSPGVSRLKAARR